MLLDGQDLQVLYAVVPLVFVLVMDVLRPQQFATEMAFHNCTMFHPDTRLDVTAPRPGRLILTWLAAISVAHSFRLKPNAAMRANLLHHSDSPLKSTGLRP